MARPSARVLAGEADRWQEADHVLNLGLAGLAVTGHRLLNLLGVNSCTRRGLFRSDIKIAPRAWPTLEGGTGFLAKKMSSTAARSGRWPR